MPKPAENWLLITLLSVHLTNSFLTNSTNYGNTLFAGDDYTIDIVYYKENKKIPPIIITIPNIFFFENLSPNKKNPKIDTKTYPLHSNIGPNDKGTFL